jgi:peptidoglycan/LPS O-acetylase OafA/YrhL
VRRLPFKAAFRIAAISAASIGYYVCSRLYRAVLDMDACGPNPAGLKKCTVPLSVPERNSVAGRFLAHISRETSSGRFIPEMDGLRFAAIGMVILFHLNGYLTAKSPFYHAAPPTSDWLAQAAIVGFRGVELFFVISGFILGLPFAAHYLKAAAPVNLRKYYLRRLTRLEPPYIIALLVLFLLAAGIEGAPPASFYPHLAASLFYLHSLIYGTFSPAMGVAWSLEIEVQFYVLVPLLTLLFTIRSRAFRRSAIALLIVAALAGQALFLHHNPRASLSILAYVQFFLVGFLLADVFLASWGEVPRRNLAWDFVALAGWPLLFVILHSQVLAHWLFPAWIFLLYLAAFRGRFVNRFFSSRWIIAIGGMCYSIYLLHYEVISAVGRLTRRLGEAAPYWIYLSAQVVLVGAAIVVICGVYFVAIEKPCMRRDWPQRLWDYGQRMVFAKFRLETTAE